MKLFPNDQTCAVQFVRFPYNDNFLFKVILLDENSNLFECFCDEKTFNHLKELEKKNRFPSLTSEFYFEIYSFKGELRIKLFS